jgi:hypothetical protein
MLCTGDELRPYIQATIGVTLPENATFIGDVRDGAVHSAAAFVNWCGHDVEVHLASAGVLSRAFLRRLGEYVFGELGCTRASCRVAADNPWKNVLTRMGWVQEGRLRRGFDGVSIDMLIFGILKEDYRYGR